MFFPILEAMTFTEHDSAEAAVDALITMYDAVVELAEEALGSGNHELYRDVVYPKLIVDVKQWRPAPNPTGMLTMLGGTRRCSAGRE